MTRWRSLRRLELLEQRVTTGSATQIPLVDLPAWPAADRVAFEQAEAAGDEATAADLVERHTGIRPGRGPVTMIIADCVGERCP